MNKFNFDDYKDKKYVMLCRTEKEAKEFCDLMNANGMKWNTGQSYIHSTNWGSNEEPICYFFNKGTVSTLRYAILIKECTILNWSDFSNPFNIDDKVRIKYLEKNDVFNNTYYVNNEITNEIFTVKEKRDHNIRLNQKWYEDKQLEEVPVNDVIYIKSDKIGCIKTVYLNGKEILGGNSVGEMRFTAASYSISEGKTYSIDFTINDIKEIFIIKDEE